MSAQTESDLHYFAAEWDAANGEIQQGRVEDARARLVSFARRLHQVPISELSQRPLSDWAVAAALAAHDLVLANSLIPALEPTSPYTSPMAVSPACKLKEWCDRNGAKYLRIEEPREIVIEASPDTPRIAYSTEPVEYAEIPYGRAVGGWDFAFGSDGTVLIDTYYQPIRTIMAPYPHSYAEPFGEILHFLPRRQEDVAGNVLFLSAPPTLHYGHWVLDFLPRLRALEVIGDPRVRVAVPDDITRKLRDTLAEWSLGEDRLVRCRRDTVYRFEKLHVLRPGRPVNPGNVRRVRERLYKAVEPYRPGTRVYAGRNQGLARSITNWTEVQELIEKEGFFEVELSELSHADQQALMADAEILMGVYGSNLMAQYLAPKACHVITLMPEGLEDTGVAHISAAFGLRHHYLVCKASNVGYKNQLRRTELVVDTHALHALLRRIDAGEADSR